MKKIVLIQGPDIDLSGHKDTQTSGDIHCGILQHAQALDIECEFVRGETEGALVTALHRARYADGVILEAPTFASYSIAIRDAIASIPVPVVEVSPAHSDAPSLLSPVCLGSIAGLGERCYRLALKALRDAPL